MNASRNFTLEELQCPCCKTGELKPEMLTRLQAIRDFLGFPLMINSGFRCQKHNQEIGGKISSFHLTGEAIDIGTNHLNSTEKHHLMKAAIHFGFGGIGIYPNFVHLDLRTGKSDLWVG